MGKIQEDKKKKHIPMQDHEPINLTLYFDIVKVPETKLPFVTYPPFKIEKESEQERE